MADQEALAALRQQVHLQEQLEAQEQVIKKQEQQLHEQQQRTQNEPHSSGNSAQPRSGHAPQSSAPAAATTPAATANTDVCRVAVKLPPFEQSHPRCGSLKSRRSFPWHVSLRTRRTTTTSSPT
ncbi:hypothetical protein HPB49_002699 [Dermacentor silvarum]|uniref:Uncharacterized protein n=1 Tax=Dermacentor silvarum TaxID=543639 RepID=A0ACB8CP94_DERSI|nr:hypothetical protein HPB49_002699 [Dermacentor silvarum]